MFNVMLVFSSPIHLFTVILCSAARLHVIHYVGFYLPLYVELVSASRDYFGIWHLPLPYFSIMQMYQ